MTGGFYEGSDIKLKVDVRGMGFDQSSNNYQIDIYNDNDKLTFTQNDMIGDGEGNYFLAIPYNRVHSGSLVMVVTAFVPDTDFGTVRRDVAKPIRLPNVIKIM